MEHLDKTFAQGQTLNAVDLNDIVSKINEGVDNINILAAENMTNEIYLDFTKTDPATIVTGDINGEVIQYIRNHSHRYLAKQQETGERVICQLADDDSTVFAGDGSAAALDGTQGDVMMHVPRFFYKVEGQKADKWHVLVSLIKAEEDWQEFDGKHLIGVYEGYVADGMLYSRSGVQSTGNVSQTNFKSYARARGNGNTLVTWEQHCIMAFLFWAKYGNTNCQAIIGSGTDSYLKATGQTDSKGMHDTAANLDGNTGSINFWGLENWWGNKAEWVDNVEVNKDAVDGKWTITERDGHTRTVQGFTTPTGEWAYPKSVTLGIHLDMVGKTLGGDSAHGLCDGQYLGASTHRVVLRSNFSADSVGGVVCALANYGASNANDYCGSRLAFHGEIRIEPDVATFLAL